MRNATISMAAVAAVLTSVVFTVSQAGAETAKSSSEVRANETQMVARFDRQVTGVAVAEDGRVFVNFPRWTEDTPISVALVGANGQLTPYPNAEWNAWRNAGTLSPENHFVCVQSVVADRHGNLWVVDPGAPGIGTIVKGAPKLVRIDLASNQVVKVIPFDETVAIQGSYLNDIRFAPDGRYGYMSDAGAKGALIVVNLESGRARRLLDGHPSTQAEPGLILRLDGHELRRTDGRPAVFNADGLAVSADGRYVIWQALNGRTLYRISTAALNDPSLSKSALERQVERLGPSEPSDGLWTDAQNRIFLTNFQDNAIKRRDAGGQVTIVAQDPRLRWPDSLAEGPDGSLYFTASHIQDMPWFTSGAPDRVPTTLWRLPGALPKR